MLLIRVDSASVLEHQFDSVVPAIQLSSIQTSFLLAHWSSFLRRSLICSINLKSGCLAWDVKGTSFPNQSLANQKFLSRLEPLTEWPNYHRDGWTSYSCWPNSMRTSFCGLAFQRAFHTNLFSRLGLWAFHLFGALHSDCTAFLKWQVKWNLKRINDLSDAPEQVSDIAGSWMYIFWFKYPVNKFFFSAQDS